MKKVKKKLSIDFFFKSKGLIFGIPATDCLNVRWPLILVETPSYILLSTQEYG